MFARLLRACAISLLALGLFGCGGGNGKPGDSSGTPSPPADGSTGAALTKVKLGLNWFPEAEHGGFYAAVVHGYYRDVGLDVEIVPGGPKSLTLQELAQGRVDFSVENADKLLLARAQQADVVAVMCPIQDSPRCIMVHAGSGIESFEQLVAQSGFTLAMNPGHPFAQFLAKRFDLSRLQVAPYPGNVSQFLLDPKFAQQAYSFSEPFVAEQQGAQVRTLMVSDLGFNTYTSLLAVQGDRLKTDPDLVSRMVSASIKGWQQYLEQPDETNRWIHEKNAEMPLDVLEFGVRDLQKLCRPDGETTALGTMTRERWETLHRQMEEIGALDAGAVNVDAAYSLQFLNQQTSED